MSRKPYPSEVAARLLVRMPAETYDAITDRAKEARRSRSSEACLLIEKGLKDEAADTAR